MAVPKNKSLYKKVIRDAKKKFKSPSGVYRSAWIVREYLKRGGKYDTSKKPSSKTGLKRWFKEGWVDISTKDHLSCGRPTGSKRGYPVCRPSRRITSKTPKTVKELSYRERRRAISQKKRLKETGNIKFGGGPQYRGRRSSVMIPVPDRVKKWGAYFFKLKKLGFKGAIETGNKRAKQLATKDSIPIEDLRYMRNWYARHIYTSYPTFKKWNDAGRPKDKRWHNKRGIQAWISWGGNPGFNWINSTKVINLLNRHFGTDYKKINS